MRLEIKFSAILTTYITRYGQLQNVDLRYCGNTILFKMSAFEKRIRRYNRTIGFLRQVIESPAAEIGLPLHYEKVNRKASGGLRSIATCRRAIHRPLPSTFLGAESILFVLQIN